MFLHLLLPSTFIPLQQSRNDVFDDIFFQMLLSYFFCISVLIILCEMLNSISSSTFS